MQELLAWASGLPYVRQVLAGTLTLLLGWRVAVLARHAFVRASQRTSADLSIRVLVGRAVYLGVLAIAVIWALDVAGVNATTLVAALGILGLAVSLSLQDVLKNFFAGVYLLFERPFRIGDEITVKDFRGRVVDVGIRITSLRTEDGVLVLIPNSILLSEVVTNRSA